MDQEVRVENYLFCSCFLAEWGIGWILARRRWKYLTNLWLIADLVSALPLATLFQLARLSRFGRLLRFAKLGTIARARRSRFPVDRLLRAVGAAASVGFAGALGLEAVQPDTVAGCGEP